MTTILENCVTWKEPCHLKSCPSPGQLSTNPWSRNPKGQHLKLSPWDHLSFRGICAGWQEAQLCCPHPHSLLLLLGWSSPQTWTTVNLCTSILLCEKITSFDFIRDSLLWSPTLEQRTLLSRRSVFLSHPTIWDLRYCIKNFGLDHRNKRAFLAFTLSWADLTYRRRTRSRKWGGGGSALLRELSSKFPQNNLSERILLNYLHKRENYKSQINKGRTRCSHVLFGTRFNICPFGFLPFGSGFEFWLQPGNLVEFRWRAGLCWKFLGGQDD